MQYFITSIQILYIVDILYIVNIWHAFSVHEDSIGHLSIVGKDISPNPHTILWLVCWTSLVSRFPWSTSVVPRFKFYRSTSWWWSDRVWNTYIWTHMLTLFSTSPLTPFVFVWYGMVLISSLHNNYWPSPSPRPSSQWDLDWIGTD